MRYDLDGDRETLHQREARGDVRSLLLDDADRIYLGAGFYEENDTHGVAIAFEADGSPRWQQDVASLISRRSLAWSSGMAGWSSPLPSSTKTLTRSWPIHCSSG